MMRNGQGCTVQQDKFKYASQYCEENVWHLCQELRFQGLEKYVLIISNPLRACAFWQQRTTNVPQLQVWDYHVVLLVCDSAWFVWDLDSLLSLPVPMRLYLDETFSHRRLELTLYAPRFRIIEASEYVKRFSSDRSHMRNKNGDWLAPQPAWSPILKEGVCSLPQLIDFRPGVGPESLTLSRVYELFA
jgi:hypothetical protein